MGRNKLIILVLIAASTLWASSLQEELNTAKKLWEQGNCHGAMRHLKKVIARINDFPENVQPQINKLFMDWNDEVQKQDSLNEVILKSIPSIPSLRDSANNMVEFGKIQQIRDSLSALLNAAESISCYDIKMITREKIQVKIDSLDELIDNYVDEIIEENETLKATLDSIEQLLSRRTAENLVLRAMVDSLKREIAVKSDQLDKIQAQLDTVLTMIKQTLEVVSPEESRVLSSPSMAASAMLMNSIENKIVAIGEGKIARKNYTDDEKDSLLKELSDISDWLDTSIVAQLDQERAQALQNLCHHYMDMLFAQEKSGEAIRWIALAILILIAVVSLGLMFARNRR